MELYTTIAFRDDATALSTMTCNFGMNHENLPGHSNLSKPWYSWRLECIEYCFFGSGENWSGMGCAVDVF